MFQRGAREESGQFADEDICLSVLVSAQEDVGETDWMKAVNLAVHGFEGVGFTLGRRLLMNTNHEYGLCRALCPLYGRMLMSFETLSVYFSPYTCTVSMMPAELELFVHL